MWQLIDVNTGTVQYRILNDTSLSITLGRSKQCNVILDDHLSISRTHCIISIVQHSNINVSNPSTNDNTTPTYYCHIYDQSKFGLYINKQSAITKTHIELHNNDIIAFGSDERNVMKLQWIPITVCMTSCHKHRTVVNQCTQLLGATIHNDVNAETTKYVLLGNSSITNTVLYAIIHHIKCITVPYLQYVTDTQHCNEPLPDPFEYRLHSTDMYIEHALNVAFQPDITERLQLFANLNVLLNDQSIYTALHTVINACGGQAHCITDHTTINEYQQLLPYVIVVASSSSHTHYSQHSTDTVSTIQLNDDTGTGMQQYVISIGAVACTESILDERLLINCIVCNVISSVYVIRQLTVTQHHVSIPTVMKSYSFTPPTNGSESTQSTTAEPMENDLNQNELNDSGTPDVDEAITTEQFNDAIDTDIPTDKIQPVIALNGHTDTDLSVTSLHVPEPVRSNKYNADNHNGAGTYHAQPVKRFKKCWPVGYRSHNR